VVRCFLAFCLISSAVYVINDIIDAPKDRLHPEKCSRPIANGKIKVSIAVVYAVGLLAAGISLTLFGYGDYYVLLFASIYFILNLAYSFGLKNIAIVDCFCIAAGFILRIFAGGAAGNAPISEWLFLTMVAATLFMAFGKRRGEMVQVSDSGTTRKVLESYDLNFVNGMIYTCAGLSVVFYALWAIQSVPTMIYTVPLIIFIICKYLLIVHGKSSNGDPTSVILGDKGLMTAILLFGVISVLLLYL
jgi:4-hydroxybenzoate polyprenyltransferase